MRFLPLTGSIVNITNPVFNHATIASVRGVNVGSLPLSNLVPFVRCVEDGGIYKKDRGYILKADNNGYESLFPTHTHDPDNESTDGGAYFYVKKLNSKHLLEFNNQSAHRAEFSAATGLMQGTTTAVDTLLSGSSFILITST